MYNVFETDKTDQKTVRNSFEIRQEWSELLWEGTGLILIGQNSSGKDQN